MSNGIPESEMKELRDGFIAEARDLLEAALADALRFEKGEGDAKEIFASIFRCLHNIKGSGRAVGFDRLADYTHHVESFLVELGKREEAEKRGNVGVLLEGMERLGQALQSLASSLGHVDSFAYPAPPAFLEAGRATKEKPRAAAVEAASPSPAAKPPGGGADDLIRVNLGKIDEVIDAFSEQVILLSALDVADSKQLPQTIAALRKLALQLQKATLRLRTLPLRGLFQKLERALRDASRATGKPVSVRFEGEDLELDKTIVDQLSDPLVHMVRNSIDHGIEPADVRAAAGKAPEGRISIIARNQAGVLTLEVIDDGKGLDPAVIRRKAVEKGILDAARAESLSDAESLELIFENGFSTKDAVSDLSGRGVGMDVVRQTVRQLRGGIELLSQVGRGSTIRIRIPQNISLYNGFLCQYRDHCFVVPSSQVVRVLNVADFEVRSNPAETPLLSWEGQFIPVYTVEGDSVADTDRVLRSRRSLLLVVTDGARKFSVAVDSIRGIQRVVHKPVGPEGCVLPGTVGATILGDGTCVPVLDLVRVHEHIRRAQAA